jgi:hypothetical protein
LLPTYETKEYDNSSPNYGCPVTAWEASATTGDPQSVYTDHAGLNNVELYVPGGGTPCAYTTASLYYYRCNRQFKPVDPNSHQGHKFYVRITADGTNSIQTNPHSRAYFTMYELKVGCYHDSFTVAENPALTTLKTWYLGSTGTGAYVFSHPSSDTAWCVLE